MDRTDSTLAMQSLMTDYADDSDPEDMDTSGEAGTSKLFPSDAKLLPSDAKLLPSDASFQEEEKPSSSSPEGRCSRKLQEKIANMLRKQAERGVDFNRLIQRRTDFRNPSIYDKLVLLCGIDEIGTNYPQDVYNPHCWKADEFYDELARQQKVDMDRREREKRERTKVEFVSGTKKPIIPLILPDPAASASTASDKDKPKERKSKWDQQAAAANIPVVTLRPSQDGSGGVASVKTQP